MLFLVKSFLRRIKIFSTFFKTQDRKYFNMKIFKLHLQIITIQVSRNVKQLLVNVKCFMFFMFFLYDPCTRNWFQVDFKNRNVVESFDKFYRTVFPS